MLIDELKIKKNKLILSKSNNGLGVFANDEINKNEILMEFKGALFFSSSLDLLHKNYFHHYLQIDSSLFIGLSGGIDDFFNHSCDPNTWVKIIDKRAFLVALRNIKNDEEITFDYSTTMLNDDWSMLCKCGNKSCRKIIKEFKYLPKDIQEKYITMAIVPKYVIEGIKR